MTLSNKIFKQDRMYGSVAVGTKGQVVIPVQARKDLNIKPGDTLIVMGKLGTALGLMKAEALEGFIKLLMQGVEKTTHQHFKQDLRQYHKRILKSIGRK